MSPFLLILVLFVTLILPIVTAADSPPSTLDFELLLATSVAGTIQCSPANTPGNGEGTGTFSVSGVALGPYPGTFTESGSLTIGFSPNTQLRLSAAFQIVSGSTIITGTKFYEGPTIAETPNCDPDSGAFLAISEVDRIEYEAIIHTPDGSFRDQGRTTFAIHECGTLAACQEAFGQQFQSALTEPCKFKHKKDSEEDDCKIK